MMSSSRSANDQQGGQDGGDVAERIAVNAEQSPIYRRADADFGGNGGDGGTACTFTVIDGSQSRA
jgi:hypothetical protein